MNWKPGMPVIGCPTENQALLGVSTYLQWLIHNQQVFEQANQVCRPQLCGTQQNFRDVQLDFQKDSCAPRELEGKKQSMREILDQAFERVIAQNGVRA